MQGNVFDWCYDAYQSYPASSDEALADEPETGIVADANRRVLRGGSFDYLSSFVRSATRDSFRPDERNSNFGLRPARTYHLSPLPLYPLPAQAPPQAGRNLNRK
jgi:formylglycine-generating enzyme required for sulfatase activity